MNTDPEGMSLLAKVLAAAAAVLYVPWKAWNFMDNRFAKKHQVADSFQTLTGELATQRQTLGEVFKQIRENDQRAVDRHLELMSELGRKADR